MFGFREFNLCIGAALLAAALGAARADEIRTWTDADGNVHYSITGNGVPTSEDEGTPVLRGRVPSEDEHFSVQASLRRREIEDKLARRSADLDRIRAEAEATRAKKFSAWVPTATLGPDAERASLEAQRDALLASTQFDQEKVETLHRLRRQERQALKDLAATWKDFAALGDEVRARYGAVPIWFRERLDCGTCPSAAAVEEALHPKKVEPKETPAAGTEAATASGSAEPPPADDEDWGDEDEDWQ